MKKRVYMRLLAKCLSTALVGTLVLAPPSMMAEVSATEMESVDDAETDDEPTADDTDPDDGDTDTDDGDTDPDDGDTDPDDGDTDPDDGDTDPDDGDTDPDDGDTDPDDGDTDPDDGDTDPDDGDTDPDDGDGGDETNDPIDIASAQISIGSYSKVFDGKEKTPSLTVKVNGATLRENTDYSVEYDNNVDAGTATVAITGEGDYEGEATASFSIEKATPKIKVSAVNDDEKTISSIKVGEEATAICIDSLEPNEEDEDAEDIRDYNITFSSSSSKIFTVSADGEIVGKSAGTAKLIAKVTYDSDTETRNFKEDSVSTSLTVKAVAPSAPTGVKAAKAKKKGIIISWNKVSGADGYYLYRTDKGTKKAYKDIKTNSYTDTSVTEGTTYTYSVKAYKGSLSSSASSNVSCMAPLATPKAPTLTNPKAGVLQVKWAKNKNVSGYQIQYANNKSFKKAASVNITKNSTTFTKIPKLKKNTTYYVKIRTSKKSGKNTVYSSWSSAASKKLTK
ncbi:MAG: fibronectin type III domain-containing protein [Lachnospiraceae bacterium]|nr:fibronectin type III domain-containing protein [Lachnospiraceae bacterium]